MTALIGFELQKVWKKGSFLSLMLLLLLVNLFLLWYLNQPGKDEPPLSAYKAVYRDISDMTEQEKLTYILGLKEQAEGLSLVEQVRSLYSQGSQSGDSLAKQLKENNSDLYKKYEKLYRAGDYLIYTDSLTAERTLLDELCRNTAVSLAAYPFSNPLRRKKISEAEILPKVPPTMQDFLREISSGSHQRG